MAQQLIQFSSNFLVFFLLLVAISMPPRSCERNFEQRRTLSSPLQGDGFSRSRTPDLLWDRHPLTRNSHLLKQLGRNQPRSIEVIYFVVQNKISTTLFRACYSSNLAQWKHKLSAVCVDILVPINGGHDWLKDRSTVAFYCRIQSAALLRIINVPCTCVSRLVADLLQYSYHLMSLPTIFGRNQVQMLTSVGGIIDSPLLVAYFKTWETKGERSSGDGSTEKEKTLAIVKPDGIVGNYTASIEDIILKSGFSIVKKMNVQLDEDTVKKFYAEHSSKSFFPDLVAYMTSGPILIMVLEKVNAVSDWRALIGPTDAQKAKISHPYSIRAMCGVDIERNCVHGSDSKESSEREISFFFEATSSGQKGRASKHDEL